MTGQGAKLRASSDTVVLGKMLGRGGEGNVHEIVGKPDLVAKIYHKPLSAQKQAKIGLMTTLRSERLSSLTAWPLGLLHDAHGTASGILMPRINGHKDIHVLYSPRSRKTDFPRADWRFLLRTAANVARAFAVVHEAGCVIGDVNHGGVIVSDHALVKLIDCDSFQVAGRGQRFLCEVGVPTFTPPELQGKPFRGVVRTPNHDNFGLSVLIFQLLFMGRHPFAGRYAKGDLSIEDAISQFRFAYSADRRALQMEPPPNVPEPAVASQPVALLLERAFSRQTVSGGRPTPAEWIAALQALEKRLVQCRANSSHFHLAELSACPWCSYERATGAVLFNVYVAAGSNPKALFDVTAIWARIAAIAPPGNLSLLWDRSSVGSLTPNPDAAPPPGSSFRQLVIPAAIIAACVLWWKFPAAWILWVFGAVFAIGSVSKKLPDPAEHAKGWQVKFNTAEAQYLAVKERWDRDASGEPFRLKVMELEAVRREWEQVPALRQTRYRQLEQEREKQQRQLFLERFTIEAATIPGIGPGRKTMLQSYNIETAWDIVDRRLQRVPGFGPALIGKLITWRRGVESRFRFDSSKGVDPRKIADLDREMDEVRQKLEEKLATGPAQLEQIRNQIITTRRGMADQVNAAFRAMLQAEADLKAARGG